MNKPEIIRRAKGDSVTESWLNNSVISALEQNEQPHYIFPLAGGLSIDGSKSSVVKYDWKIIITNIRILLIKDPNSWVTGKESGIRIDQIAISKIRDFDGNPGGILSAGSITIETTNHVYSGTLHRKVSGEDINGAWRHIQNWDGESVNTEQGRAEIANSGSATAHAHLDKINIIESYGTKIAEGSYSLEIDTEGLHFKSNKLMENGRSVSVQIGRIDFNKISTSSQRDFSKENRSRYLNILNPLLGNASPTKKGNKETLRISLDNGNKYITLSPGSRTSFEQLLDGMSRIDPRLDSDNPSAVENSTGTDKNTTESQSALDTLKQRLAEGEISPEEFEERRQYLE